jgi:hypothetical protein
MDAMVLRPSRAESIKLGAQELWEAVPIVEICCRFGVPAIAAKFRNEVFRGRHNHGGVMTAR